jgi:hypothetical protein
MSGGLEGLRQGDPLVVYTGPGQFRYHQVARVARVWLTDNWGWRHRIADGTGLSNGIVTVALTAGQHAERQAAAERSRRQDTPAELTGHAFERAGCHQVDGEPLLAARGRGSAAECAADAAQCLRAGDVERARELLEAALDYLTLRGYEAAR